MAEDRLPDTILDALIENTKTIEANSIVLTQLNDTKEKEELKEQNLVQKPKVEATLTSKEKARYENIGKELFKPFISSLKKMLDQERRANVMSATHEEEPIKENLKIQYSEKKKEPEDKSDDFWSNIISIIAIIGLAVYAFRDKIAEFFTGLWDKVVGIFSSIWDFFNPFNKSGPISNILTSYISFWTGLWGKIWDFIKPAFSKLGELGGTIWNWIKGAWDRFITGPNGILSFGTSVWGSLKNFVSNGFGAISDFIVSSIVDPLKSIFGDSKDDAEKAAKEEKEGIQKNIKQNTEKLQEDSEAINEFREKSSEFSNRTSEANESAAGKDTSMRYMKNKNFDAKKLKESAANNALNSFLKRYNIDADENERKRYQEIFEKHISVQNGEAKFNMREITSALKKQAEIDSDDQWYDTKLVDTLQDIQQGDLDDLSGDIEEGMRNYMEEAGAGTISQNAPAPGINGEELANNIPPEQTEFAAAQELIIQSVTSLQSSMESFDNNIIQTFTNIFEGFIDKFIKALKVDVSVTTPQHIDNKTYDYDKTERVDVQNSQVINDYSPTLINVIPVSKKSFAVMNEKIYGLVEKSVDIISSQNAVLADIRTIIERKGVEAKTDSAAVVMPVPTPSKQQGLSRNGNSQITSALVSDLWNTSKPFTSFW